MCSSTEGAQGKGNSVHHQNWWFSEFHPPFTLQITLLCIIYTSLVWLKWNVVLCPLLFGHSVACRTLDFDWCESIHQMALSKKLTNSHHGCSLTTPRFLNLKNHLHIYNWILFMRYITSLARNLESANLKKIEIGEIHWNYIYIYIYRWTISISS
jgi:hypothetical protein